MLPEASYERVGPNGVLHLSVSSTLTIGSVSITRDNPQQLFNLGLTKLLATRLFLLFNPAETYRIDKIDCFQKDSRTNVVVHFKPPADITGWAFDLIWVYIILLGVRSNPKPYVAKFINGRYQDMVNGSEKLILELMNAIKEAINLTEALSH